jgi:ATPase subunit of ABC transporter with duplicated ATPase domains
MSAFITLDSVSAATPDGRGLFTNLSLTVGPERIGLVGRNGVGKSTLLAIMAGTLAPTAGAVSHTGTVGYLEQTPDLATDDRLIALLGAAEAWDRLARVEAGQGDGSDFAEADWTLPARLDQALAEVGLDGIDPARPASGLSGGQAMRAALARQLLSAPDVLLLDEPTNNLDAEARDLMARILSRWRGGAVVVSHDRTLLGGMDRIVELSSLGARSYGGGYALYAQRKAEETAAAARDLDEAERETRRVARDAQLARERQARRDAAGQRFAARGGAPKILLGALARRAEQSAGRASLLAQRQAGEAAERRAQAEARIERLSSLDVDLPASNLPAGKPVLAFEAVSFAWPDGRRVVNDLSFRIVGPERLALCGRNGAGKTTVIRLATGALQPTAGLVRRGVTTAVLDQTASFLDDSQTLLETFRRLNPNAGLNDAHAALARFLFRNAAAQQRVGTLSGGERLRAALACRLCSEPPPQFLILDEPTNHLDLASLAAVEAALSDYDGALMVVSHDAAFLEAIGVERRVVLGGCEAQARDL